MIKFVVIKEIKFSNKNKIEVGTIVDADFQEWKTYPKVEIYNFIKNDDKTRYTHSHCLVDRVSIIPFFKWREKQMDSILS